MTPREHVILFANKPKTNDKLTQQWPNAQSMCTLHRNQMRLLQQHTPDCTKPLFCLLAPVDPLQDTLSSNDQ
jgi:hypothetical protein